MPDVYHNGQPISHALYTPLTFERRFVWLPWALARRLPRRWFGWRTVGHGVAVLLLDKAPPAGDRFVITYEVDYTHETE